MNKSNVKELFEDCVKVCSKYSNEAVFNYRSFANDCEIIIKDCNGEISTIGMILIGNKLHIQYIYLTEILQNKGLCSNLLNILEKYYKYLNEIIVDTVLNPILENHLKKLGYIKTNINGFDSDYVKKL